MSSNGTFMLLNDRLNLDCVEDSTFHIKPYALSIQLNKPIAENGYGKVTVDGKALSKGVVVRLDGTLRLLVSAGEIAKEYDKEYTLSLSGFVAEDGSVFEDQTFRFRTLPRGKKDPAYAAQDALALQAAREGIVLLKNENGALPVAEDSILNCFGAAQFIFRNTSTGASLIKPRWQANFYQAVAEHSAFSVNETISDLYQGLKDVVPTQDQLKAAQEKSDIAVIFISRASGEWLDNKPIKGGYYLTDEERALVQAVTNTFSKTIAILNTGYPIEMGWIDELGISAVIYTGFAGQAAGYALVEILDGRTNPSAKLPDTFAYDYYDYPSAHNFINFGEKDEVPGDKDKGVLLFYEEDIYVGYRYFDSFGKKAAYCFGHGLSYTRFELQCDDVAWNGNQISVSACVKNIGEMSGKEVVQLYVAPPKGKLEKPYRVLAAFEKTNSLQCGESQCLKLTADAGVFASYDECENAYMLEAGEYGVFCGNSLESAIKVGSFILPESIVVKKTGCINPPVADFHRITRKDPAIRENSRMVALEERIPVPAIRQPYNPPKLNPYTGAPITFPMLQADHSLLDAFVSQMSDEELCRLNVCDGANWYEPWQDGSAGKTAKLQKYMLPSIKVSDGNTGLNIKELNIGFPSSTVIAATFNKEIAWNVGKTLGELSIEYGIAVNLGPGMNIHRNILNGRHAEYFSEDPVLAGIMAGYHGKGIMETGTGCTYKHLCCNNSDTSRKGSHSIVSQQALREIYYRVFEIAFSIQMPAGVMTSYNAVNGLYPAENAQVLQELVRNEWGFQGVIMTDWGTYDTVDCVEMVKAGNCWLTEGSADHVGMLHQAVKDGRLPRENLENNVCYLVKLVLKHAKAK